MNNKRFALRLEGFFFLLLMANTTCALDIAINIKSDFSLGETVYFEYVITSEKEQQITFTPYIDCPSAPLKLLEEETVTVNPKSPHSATYNYLTIKEFTEPQNCTACVEITSPVYLKEEKTFKIETKPSFDLELNTCKDSECKEKAKIFVIGETIYLDFNSSIESPAIETTLEFPDGIIKEITLPYSLEAEILGTYNLTVRATKEGLKEMEKTVQFGVIEKEAEIQEVREIVFSVKACEDAECSIEKEEFQLGETAYIDFDSAEEGIEVSALVIFPDETKREVTLPASIELKQAGYHIIEATAKKEGFEEKTEIIAIQAIEAPPEKPKEAAFEVPPVFLVGIAVAVILFLIFMVFSFRRR